MNRTIKFRGKDDNGQWRYGDLITWCGATETQIKDWHSDLSDYDVDVESIGQFIGLCDVNGTQIFEGDIVCREGITKNSYFQVCWNDRKYTFFIGNTPLEAFLKDEDRLIEFRIVGNIHDNPELLLEGGGE